MQLNETATIAIILLQLITVILLIAVIVKLAGRAIAEPKKERSAVDDELTQVNNRLKDAEKKQEQIRRNYDEAKNRDRNRDNRDNRDSRPKPENRDNRDKPENRDNRDRPENRDNRDRGRDRNRDNRNFRGGNRPDNNRNFDRDKNRNRDFNRPAPAVPASGEAKPAFAESAPESAETKPETAPFISTPTAAETPAAAPQAMHTEQSESHGHEVEMEHGRRPVFKRRPLLPEGHEAGTETTTDHVNANDTPAETVSAPAENKENSI